SRVRSPRADRPSVVPVGPMRHSIDRSIASIVQLHGSLRAESPLDTRHCPNDSCTMLARIVRCGVVGLAGAALLALSGCDFYAPPWSTIHADAANTDYSPVTGTNNLTMRWHRHLDGNFTVGATIDEDGRVYVTTGATSGCNLHVLDGATGNDIWCSDALDR